MHTHCVSLLWLCQRRTAIRAIAPVGLHGASATWAGARWGQRVRALPSPTADGPHQPDHTQHGQHDKANGDQPHEEHRDPAEWSKAPSAHHAWPHHSPTAVTPAAQQACPDQKGYEHDDPEHCYSRPIDLVHCECPPYTCYFTTISSVMPGWNVQAARYAPVVV